MSLRVIHYDKMTVQYVQLVESNISLLDTFLSTTSSKHFRYYNSRSTDRYKHHIYTVVGILNEVVISYGHLELDGRYWLGLCVHHDYRSNGYGKDMLLHLINCAKSKGIPKLSLSVDKDNIEAISLYKKYGFITVYDKEHYYLMILELSESAKVIDLPVSYGEAFDKLAILEIKMNKVSQEKKMHVKREYDLLNASLEHLWNENIRFYYRHLVECSTIIWDTQVEFRVAEGDRVSLCDEIIFENDRRGKLKNKINKILSSYLVEQKDGYQLKRVFVSVAEGYLSVASAYIRYLATVYDQVLVHSNEECFDILFSDDSSIVSTQDPNCPDNYTHHKPPYHISSKYSTSYFHVPI